MTDGGSRAHHRRERYPAALAPVVRRLAARGRARRVTGAGLVLVLAFLVAACGARLPEPIRDWPVVTATVDGRPLRLVVAVDRQQGLGGVVRLTGADGMLFDFGRETEPATARFWMRDVLIPLDIAWFDGDGQLVATATMARCEHDCPTHDAPRPFRWAIETPAGSLALRDGAVLELAE